MYVGFCAHNLSIIILHYFYHFANKYFLTNSLSRIDPSGDSLKSFASFAIIGSMPFSSNGLRSCCLKRCVSPDETATSLALICKLLLFYRSTALQFRSTDANFKKYTELIFCGKAQLLCRIEKSRRFYRRLFTKSIIALRVLQRGTRLRMRHRKCKLPHR